MAVQTQDDQHEHTFSSYVRIRYVVLKTCLGRWTIGRSVERGSGISVLPARHDDDDENRSKMYSTTITSVRNNKAQTYLNPSTGSWQAIDIIVHDPSTNTDDRWKKNNNGCESKNFPIIFGSPQRVQDKLLCWKIRKANWEEFKTLCIPKLIQVPNTKDLKYHFTETLTPKKQKKQKNKTKLIQKKII